MHQRAVIRNYVVALLKGNTDAGQNVFGKITGTSTEIPRISVQARRDTVLALHSEEPVKYQRTLSLAINIETAGDEDIANNLADQVEILILGDYRLGKTAARATLVDTILVPDTEGEQLYYDASIIIDVDYISTFQNG